MEVYTMEKWNEDESFKALPGQEITEDVYNKMFNCMPPGRLPHDVRRQALEKYNLPISAGFLMGEPAADGKKGPLFMAFGYSYRGYGKHYYYLGLAEPISRRNGAYYFIDCMNAFVTGLYPERDFKTDAAAIRTAADYEATLYKHEYKNGELVKSTILYKPEP